MRICARIALLLGLSAVPSLGAINIRLVADKTILQPGQTTAVRLLAQATSAGLYSLSGNIVADGTTNLLTAAAESFSWVDAFRVDHVPFRSIPGSAGSDGGWVGFGSMQPDFLSPDRTFGKADYVELANYRVTAQPGAGTVSLRYDAVTVPAFPPLECDASRVLGSVTPVWIQVQAGLAGDVTGDGHVDTEDLLRLSDAWGSRIGGANWDPACDLNHNGAVDVVDLLIVAGNWAW